MTDITIDSAEFTKLNGKVAIITGTWEPHTQQVSCGSLIVPQGGSSGIGLATAQLFASKG